MRIFSNFDTHFLEKVYTKRLEKFPEDQILVIQRSIYYFIFRVIIPAIILVTFAIFAFIFLGKNEWMQLAIYPLGLVWIIVFWIRP